MILRDDDTSLPYPAPTEEAPVPRPITSAPSDKTMRAEVLGVMNDESSDGVCEESQDGPTRSVGDIGLTRAISIEPPVDVVLMRELFDARYAAYNAQQRDAFWEALDPEMRSGWERLTRRASALGAKVR